MKQSEIIDLIKNRIIELRDFSLHGAFTPEDKEIAIRSYNELYSILQKINKAEADELTKYLKTMHAHKTVARKSVRKTAVRKTKRA